MDDDDVGSGGPQQRAGEGAGGPVGGVDDDAQPVQPAAGEGPQDVLAVGPAVLDVDELRRVAVGRRQGPDLGLDASLDVVGQFGATAGEQLDAVVAIGVVGRRDDRPEAVATGRLERHDRRRHDAEAVDDDALAGQPGDEGGLQHRGREAGVAADDGLGTAEHAGRGAAEVERERRRQIGVGDAADAVGAELHRAGAGAPSAAQRFVNCGALRAFLRPYFLLSFFRESRVSKPAFLRVPRDSGSSSTSERASAMRSAPA